MKTKLESPEHNVSHKNMNSVRQQNLQPPKEGVGKRLEVKECLEGGATGWQHFYYKYYYGGTVYKSSTI